MGAQLQMYGAGSPPHFPLGNIAHSENLTELFPIYPGNDGFKNPIDIGYSITYYFYPGLKPLNLPLPHQDGH